MSSAARNDVSIEVPGSAHRLHAWHWTAASEALEGPHGRPVVVMAHGLAGTKDSGLEPFAEAFAAAGADVVAFDYRGFGASEGEPRQTVSIDAQLADYRAAVSAAATLPGVDPGRVVLWGVSLAGGHVLRVAADRTDIAAVISMTPLVDGRAAGALAFKHHKPTQIMRSTAAGVKSRVAKARGRDAVFMPVVAEPGEFGALTISGAAEQYRAIAGPTWVNEIDAGVGLELGAVKCGPDAARVEAPVLVQVADFDRSAPAQAAMKVAFKARAHVRHYPCDHFDVWPGFGWFEAASRHQVHFLTQALGGAADRTDTSVPESVEASA